MIGWSAEYPAYMIDSMQIIHFIRKEIYSAFMPCLMPLFTIRNLHECSRKSFVDDGRSGRVVDVAFVNSVDWLLLILET